MLESILVIFHVEMHPNVTLRDYFQSISYTTLKIERFTIGMKRKKKPLTGKVLRVEDIPNLRYKQTFELFNSSAKQSVPRCTIDFNKDAAIDYLNSNIAVIK